MSHPTDETSEPTSAEASIGPSSLFEVEELTPDGGPPAAERAREPAPPPPDGGPVAAPAPAATPEVQDDDDEPPPQLVWYVLKVQSSREDTIRDALERRVKIQGLGRFFGQIVVPTEKI